MKKAIKYLLAIVVFLLLFLIDDSGVELKKRMEQCKRFVNRFL